MVIRRRNKRGRNYHVPTAAQDLLHDDDAPLLEQALVLQQFVHDVQRHNRPQYPGISESSLGTGQNSSGTGQNSLDTGQRDQYDAQEVSSPEQASVHVHSVPSEDDPEDPATKRSIIVKLKRPRGNTTCQKLDQLPASEGMNIEVLDGISRSSLGTGQNSLGRCQQNQCDAQDACSPEQALVLVQAVPPENELKDPGTEGSIVVKRHRGKTTCRKLDRIPVGEGLSIEFLDGSPVGPNSAAFVSYLGTVIRSIVPLQIKDYRRIPEGMGESIIQKLQVRFRWKRTMKLDRQILSHGGVCFRNYKCYLRKRYFKEKPFELARAQVPEGVDPEQWRALCDTWATTEYISLSKKNEGIRAKAIQPTHRMGRKNLKQKKYEFMKKHGRDATQSELFEISKCVVTADGSQHWIHEQYKEQHESMAQLMVASIESDGRSPRCTAEEAYCHVIGYEHGGRIESGGCGQTPESLYAVNSRSTPRANSNVVSDITERVTSLTKENESLKKKMEEQDSQLKAQRDMMADMMMQIRKMQETMDAFRQEKVEEPMRRVGMRGRSLTRNCYE